MITTLLFVMFGMAAAPVVAPQAAPASAPGVLATVNIPTSVLAGGTPLPAGRYQIRFATGQPPAASDAQRRIEFVANGMVVARDVAEVLRDGDVPAVGDSARPATQGVRVDMLRGGEFVRVSVKQGAERYLIHLAVPGAAKS